VDMKIEGMGELDEKQERCALFQPVVLIELRVEEQYIVFAHIPHNFSL